MFVYEIKRPKKDKKLLVVLSREEVSQILSSVSNIKHKAILMLRASKKLTWTIQRMFWEDSIVPFTIKIAPNNVNPFHHLIRYLYSFVI